MSTVETPVKRVYLDLDTLFDTRLGTLATISQDAATHVMQSNLYWDRDHTNWGVLTQGLVDDATFVQRWEQRDQAVLRASIVSGIIPVLINLVTDYLRARQEGQVDYELVLEINLYPYTLELEEMDELSSILRHELLNDNLGIQFISQSLAEMTPEYIHERYAALTFYEFHQWIKLHCEALVKRPLRGIPLIVPRLFENDPSRLPIERKKEEVVAFKLWLLDYLSVEFIDARWFSLLRPKLT